MTVNAEGTAVAGMGSGEAGRRQASALLAAAREEYAAEARIGRGGRLVQARFAAQMDVLVESLVRAAGAGAGTPFVVCALGGYGRRTLCLHSDVDLLVVFDGRIGAGEERVLNALLQPLWDLRLTVGHHVRELAEFDALDDENAELLLALCDLRLISGDVPLFDALLGRVHRGEAARARRLVGLLLPLVDERHASFNNTLYQLEPDLKNAPGGLRDISAVRLMRSLAREAFAGRGRPGERLDEAEEFMLRIRSLLHLDSGRDMNVLTHDQQERVAEVLSANGGDPFGKVEQLMGEYFRHARAVTRALEGSRAVLEPRTGTSTFAPVGPGLALGPGGVTFTDPASAATQPALWLKAFQVAINRGQPVADEVQALVQEHAGRYTADYFVASEEGRRRLRALLRPVPGLAARLSDMLECGLLGTIFPEFERIHCRVIRDFYHKYTVDEHTLLTIKNLESLWTPATASRARFGSLLHEIRSPELLALALLYHDVGKWRDTGHAGESLRLAQPMLRRLGLSEEARHTVEFLIEHHLLMSQVVFRRDFTDPETVAQFASVVGSEELLKMLCLMTLVDIESVAPGILTPWKEDLLWRLYVDTYNHLTLGYADDLIEQSQAEHAEVLAGRPADVSEEELVRFLDGLPRRYLAVFGLSAIYRHVRLARGLGADEVHTSLEPRDGIWELTVAAVDRAYLFSNIAGVLSSFGMNIHRGQAITTPAHLVLDVFEFTDDEGFLRRNPGAGAEIARVLQAVVAGTEDVTTLLGGRVRSLVHQRRRTVEPRVHLDNTHSHRYTVLEIVADDAPGLLHRISRVVSDQGCDVDLVLISTEGHKAIDVLHVTKHGRQLTPQDQQALAEQLQAILEDRHETH